MNALERRHIPLLPRYKCRGCNVFKVNAHFANKELNNYRNQVGSGRQLDATSARLRCRECSGAQVQELQCEGPCGEWKSLDGFSKSQRKAGSDGWCKECVDWKGAQEPGTATTDAPGTVGGDYAGGDDNRSTILGGTETSENFVSLPYQLSTMSITDSETANATNAVFESGLSYLPPHLQDTMSVSSISNPYEDDSTMGASDSHQRPVTFTAYDSAGQAHIQQRLPSGTTQSYQAGLSSSGPSAPQALPKNTASKWAKPVGTRKPQNDSAPSAPSPPRRSGPPSRRQQTCTYESSEDEM